MRSMAGMITIGCMARGGMIYLVANGVAIPCTVLPAMMSCGVAWVLIAFGGAMALTVWKGEPATTHSMAMRIAIR